MAHRQDACAIANDISGYSARSVFQFRTSVAGTEVRWKRMGLAVS